MLPPRFWRMLAMSPAATGNAVTSEPYKHKN
jgi:hypothetical protein